jgi:hypothetical protein
MSGLRVVFPCRFPSSPPRWEPLCTPACKGRTFDCQLHAEAHPATRRAVPRDSVDWPPCRGGLVQGTRVRGLWPCAPQCQGQAHACKPPLMLVGGLHLCCRAAAPCAVPHAALACEPDFVPSLSFSCRCSCTPWRSGQAHPSAGAERCARRGGVARHRGLHTEPW